ncbi:MAG: HDOD domain-containing protein [Thioalkalispiraceae bacterium]|jgi:putative nucleotidyltransferase with HDIG domain
MRSPHELINDNLELVALPELVLKLNQMVEDPRCSANDIANVIMQDVSLSAHLLQIANSPFYSLPAKVDSVSMAITIIGTRQLKDMILATTIVNHFQAIPADLVPISQFWQHNIACATATRVIARLINNRNQERFFLAGLLHDIGKLVMYFAEPGLSRQVIEQAAASEESLNQLEQKIFGFTHSDIGAELLRQWQFPESLIEPVLKHHAPDQASQYRAETAATHLANAVANTLRPIISLDDDLPIDPDVWSYLGLSESTLDTIINETSSNIGHAFDVLYMQAA